MKSYQITYMNDDGQFRTVIHWALRNEDWQDVASRKLGTVMKVLEELSYNKWTGQKCKVLLDETESGRMRGDIIYV